MIKELKEKILSEGHLPTREESEQLLSAGRIDFSSLLEAADAIREALAGDSVELCAIVNAKSGACPEDCAYCSQSAKNKASVEVFPLLSEEAVLDKAREAKEGGVTRFSIVVSGRKPSMGELKRIGAMLGGIRDLGLLPCGSLGLLDREEFEFLRDCGLTRYHNNLETSERFFPSICTTHAFSEKIGTIEAALEAGLEVCSGGIFGMGETWEDRIDMAFTLRELGVDSTALNFLTPIDGTRLAGRKTLEPRETLTIVALYRFILPRTRVRICGGRIPALGDMHGLLFRAGADALMTGNYLTTTGRSYGDDRQFVAEAGLSIRKTGM